MGWNVSSFSPFSIQGSIQEKYIARRKFFSFITFTTIGHWRNDAKRRQAEHAMPPHITPYHDGVPRMRASDDSGISSSTTASSVVLSAVLGYIRFPPSLVASIRRSTVNSWRRSVLCSVLVLVSA